MTARAAFLAAICAAPDDDTSRLVYADWLDEHDEPARAEFIRVQCEIPRLTRGHEPELDDDPNWKRFHELCVRERSLLDGATGELPHRVEWFGGEPWPSHIHYHRFSPVYSRGFVESVTCTGADWCAYGDTILASHPVRRVTFTDGGPETVWTRDWSEDVYVAEVAGRRVELHESKVYPASATRGAVPRLILSARWPAVPPEGWGFPPPAPLVSAEDVNFVGAYRDFDAALRAEIAAALSLPPRLFDPTGMPVLPPA